MFTLSNCIICRKKLRVIAHVSVEGGPTSGYSYVCSPLGQFSDEKFHMNYIQDAGSDHCSILINQGDYNVNLLNGSKRVTVYCLDDWFPRLDLSFQELSINFEDLDKDLEQILLKIKALMVFL